MSTLRITRQADRDLEAIWAYIAQDSLRHADEMLDRLSEKFWKLAEVSGIGPPCFDIADGLHHFPVGRYNIYYVPIEDGVAIIRVLHSAQDISQFSFGEQD